MRLLKFMERHAILTGIILGLLILSCTECLSDVIDPAGNIVQFYGKAEFSPADIRQQVTKDALVLTACTKYPLTKIDYNKSDVRLKINESLSFAVKLTGPNKGKVFKNPTWITSEMFKSTGEYCRYEDGSYVIVHASGGEYVGKAGIFEEHVKGSDYKLTIVIPLKVIGDHTGQVEWATALCGNSVSTMLFTAPALPNEPSPLPYKIDPSFTNNNPVVPYWTGPSYMPPFGGFGWGGWDGGYIQNNNYIIKPCKPCPPAVPIPHSGLLLGAGLLYMLLRG